MDWIHQAQDGNQQKALVDMVMHFQFPLYAGNSRVAE
jgi:hypothetical protein